MTYLFSNPQARKWKIMFFLSLVLNIALAAAIFVNESASSEKKTDLPSQPAQIQQPVAATPEAAKNDAEAVKPSVPDSSQPVATANMAAQPSAQPAAQPAVQHDDQAAVPRKSGEYGVGDLIPVSIDVRDSLFAAFEKNDDISKYAKQFGISNLSELLSAHVARNLVWKLNLKKDIKKGDRMSFVFRMIPEAEMKSRTDIPDVLEVLAINYYSKERGQAIETYFYKPAGKKFGKQYYVDGQMIEKVIVNSPITDYIQVTSLLADRSPKHDGIDYKTPIGTPVFATVNGVVAKINWNVKYNGDSVSIRIPGKPQVLTYLHLDKVIVKPGQAVKAGEQIAFSGNTGRTTAPHLHYQVSVGSEEGKKAKILNPFVFHETTFEVLRGDDLPKFKAKVQEFKVLIEKANKSH